MRKLRESPWPRLAMKVSTAVQVRKSSTARCRSISSAKACGGVRFTELAR